MTKQAYINFCLDEIALAMSEWNRLRQTNRRHARAWKTYARQMNAFAQGIKAMSTAEFRQWWYLKRQAEAVQAWREFGRVYSE